MYFGGEVVARWSRFSAALILFWLGSGGDDDAEGQAHGYGEVTASAASITAALGDIRRTSPARSGVCYFDFGISSGGGVVCNALDLLLCQFDFHCLNFKGLQMQRYTIGWRWGW